MTTTAPAVTKTSLHQFLEMLLLEDTNPKVRLLQLAAHLQYRPAVDWLEVIIEHCNLRSRSSIPMVTSTNLPVFFTPTSLNLLGCFDASDPMIQAFGLLTDGPFFNRQSKESWEVTVLFRVRTRTITIQEAKTK